VRFYLRVADESSRGCERLWGLEALAHLDGVGLRGGLVRALVGGDRPLVVVALAGRVVVALAHGAIRLGEVEPDVEARVERLGPLELADGVLPPPTAQRH